MEDIIKEDLKNYLLSKGKIDERLPECPDIEGKWEEMAQAYGSLMPTQRSRWDG